MSTGIAWYSVTIATIADEDIDVSSLCRRHRNDPPFLTKGMVMPVATCQDFVAKTGDDEACCRRAAEAMASSRGNVANHGKPFFNLYFYHVFVF